MTSKTLDPRIGILCRNGETVYYANVPLANGDKEIVGGEFIYVEHSNADEVAAYLSK